MTTLASLPRMDPRPAPGIIQNPGVAEQLELLAEAIRDAPLPAFFAVWQDDSDSMRRFAEPVLKAGLKTPHVIQPDNLATELNRLEKRATSLAEDDGIVFLGCLSSLPDEERKRFNAARDQLLRLPTKMIFVESVADEGKVRLGFPDVLSQVSYDCRLFMREEEDPFARSDPPSPQESGEQSEDSTLLSGTVHKVHEAEAVCWLEVGPGVRVKFSVPLSLLGHLNPQPGLELVWVPGKEEESPKFWRREKKAPDPNVTVMRN